jgi:glycine dehydrogenase subunit 1
MSYIPHTDLERQQMLSAIGVTTIEDLFEAVPSTHRFPKLDLPKPMSEMEVLAELQGLAESNEHGGDFALFRGAGAYHHFVPSAVNHILLRGEFYTAYTPYQPEVSQGTLQAIFEYQSMMCTLTGMDAANASHYDGATSLAEAVTVAMEVGRHKRKKVILSPAINPQYREVVRTYHQGRDVKFVGDGGRADISDLIDMLDDNTAMVAVSYPNFFGQIDDFSKLAEKVHEAGALLVMVINPVALGLFKSPGELGADIVVGEAQPLGIPLSFGGPYLGFFGCREEYVRKIAGRIIGETVDQDGKRAYVMTLRPREQDIRREKATSNICTNQGLMSLAACIYLSLMGKYGMRRVAELCYHKAHYAAKQIDGLTSYKVDMTKPFFHEFVVKCPRPVSEINNVLIEKGIIGGIDLGKDYAHLKDHMLLCVTEMNSKDEIDALVDGLKEAANV